jgi:hypothetical protein
LWIILFTIFRMLSRWHACRAAVIYGSASIGEVSGNHGERQDSQSKCTALSWPLSHPKPSRGSWKDGQLRTCDSRWLLAHQKRVTFSCWWEMQPYIFTDQVTYPDSARFTP